MAKKRTTKLPRLTAEELAGREELTKQVARRVEYHRRMAIKLGEHEQERLVLEDPTLDAPARRAS
jgi:hypothetical protein